MSTTATLTLIWSTLLTILGLAVFEIVNSLDNAVINANILSTIRNQKAKLFFIRWGMLASVGVVRGVLPFIIYYVPNRALGLHAAMAGFWSGDPRVVAAVTQSAPLLLLAGGVFLVLLFAHWLFMENDACSFRLETICTSVGVIGFTIAVVALLSFICTYASLPLIIAAMLGMIVFFVAQQIKDSAEDAEALLITEPTSDSDRDKGFSDWSKVLFLEVIDATFSTDGVVGAFAFTMVVPYILIGNGIGAYIVRRLTLSNVDRLSHYAYLKNAALWSIGFLGSVMVSEGFGVHAPQWLSPTITFVIVGIGLWGSIRFNQRAACASTEPKLHEI